MNIGKKRMIKEGSPLVLFQTTPPNPQAGELFFTLNKYERR